MEKILNIGCGTNKLPGAVNLDLHPDADVVFDLESCGKRDSENARIEMPFPNDHFDSVQASHVLEHITNILPLMQELHRVTKPGGALFVRVPYGANPIAFEDPTHVRQFFPKSFMYFGQMAYNKADYGYRGDWKVQELIVGVADEYRGCPADELNQLLFNAWDVGQEMFVTLSAIKPIRRADGVPGKLPVTIAFVSDVHAQLEQAMATEPQSEGPETLQ